MSDKYTIQKTSPQVREAIRRNTAAALPDRPSAMGMKPHEIRAAFFKAIISENGEGSLMDELDRIVDEFNKIQHNIAREVRLSTLTIPASEWTDNTPTTAFTAIEGVEDENDSSFAALLLPVNNETRIASRDTSIYVEDVDVRGNGKITVTMKREGEPPDTDLKYVVIAFSEPNETVEAFPVSVGFIGIGGSVAGDGGDLPPVNNADNGKLLQVIDGKWTAATIPAAEGVSV